MKYGVITPQAVTRLGIATPLLIGVLGLAGYVTQTRRLVSPGPAWETLTPVGAVMLIVAAAGLWALDGPRRHLARRIAGRAAGLILLAGAATALVEHVTGRALGLDLLLFPETVQAWTTGGAPGRPMPHSAVAYVLMGLTLVLLDTDAGRGFRPGQVLASATALVAGVAAVAPIAGRARTPMPVAAVIGVTALSAGLLACRPGGVIVRLLRSRGPGGSAVRRIVLTAIGVAAAAGLMASSLPRVGESADDLAVVVTVGAPLMILFLVLLRTGLMLDRAQRTHRDLVRQLRDLGYFNRAVVHSLSEGVLTVATDGTVLEASPRWSELTGFPAADVIGLRPPYPWWTPDTVEERLVPLSAAVSGAERHEFEGTVRRADGGLLQILGTVCPIHDSDGRVRRAVITYRDLTRRLRAAAEQRRMAERLDHFFTMSHDLMCIAGTDGYFKQLNPAWERTLGYPLARLTSRPFLDFIHPDDRERSATEAARLGAGGTTVAFENRYRCHDGSYRWLSWTAAAVPDEEFIYAVARDHTAQHEADDTKARLAAIVNSTADAVIGKNLDGTILSWNPAAERIYGFPAAEAIGKPITIIFPPEAAGQIDDILARIAQGETVKMYDAVRRHKDGTAVHLALTISPILDINGKVVGAASIAHDITETKRAEERFQRLVLSAPDAMVIADDGGVLRLVNEQAERMFGYESGDLVGQPVEVLVPEHLRDVHLRHRARYLEEPVVGTMRAGAELSGVRRDGAEFPIEVSLAPLQTDEGILVAAAIRDVTRRREAERALAAARDEALAAGQLKSQFVAMVSHEIRTPMNGVIGLTNLLLDTPLQPVQKRYTESIRTSARALLAIINDILDFSKIEAGKINLSATDFDLGALLDDVAYTVADAARDKPLEILTDYPPDLPPAVLGDVGRLRQILLNLAGNAVKFTPSGEVVIRLERDGDTAAYTFSVTDTGIGIEPEGLSRLFEPFTQADTSTSRQFGGTGLGLTISRQLVDLMGGTLHAESTPGEGSQFSFTIPLSTATPGDRRPERRDQLAGRRLLVIDDNETARNHLARHARSWGMEATTTADVEHAVANLREAARCERPYQHVVIDLQLPGMTGTDLAEQIRADATIPTPSLILLTTSYAAVADTDTLDILIKPVGPSNLYNCLVQVLNPHPRAAARPEDGDVHRGDVLVAEDNEINQMVAVDTLANLGYHADIAVNGIEALELAAAKHYQVILMDCQMPRLDGYETTRELRRREPADNHTPVIAMTAGALAEDRQRCLDAGMDDHLAKPIDPDELQAALERWTQA